MLRSTFRQLLVSARSELRFLIVGSAAFIALFPFSLKAGLPACLDGYVLYSHGGTTIGNNSEISSGKSGSDSGLILNNNANVSGDLSAGGNITLGNNAKVAGNILSGGTVYLGNNAQVTGNISQHASISPCIVPQETVSSGSQDITVATNKTQSLTPGSYRNISIGTNASLQLSSGIYQIQSFSIGTNATLMLNPASGTIEILSSGAFTMGSNSKLAFSGSELPGKVLLYSGQSSTLDLGTNTTFLGTLIAPLAEISASNNQVLKGSFFGRKVTLGNNIQVSYVPFSGSPSATVVKITSPPNGFLTNQSVIPVAWTVNGVSQTTQLTENLVVEGNNTVKRCSGSVCDSINVIRDTKPPVVVILSPTNRALTNQTTISVSWSVDGIIQTTQTTENLTMEGLNTITRTATDSAGNVGTASIQVTRDTKAPVVVITSPANGFLTNNTSVPVTWTVDGVAQTSQLTEALTVEGANTITRTATDSAGNVGSASIQVTRDTQPPVVAITSPTNGFLTNQSNMSRSTRYAGGYRKLAML